jgi:hypothetical protein
MEEAPHCFQQVAREASDPGLFRFPRAGHIQNPDPVLVQETRKPGC